jgi:hypothetical protein
MPRGGAARTLARIEGTRLLRHPLFLLGLALSGVLSAGAAGTDGPAQVAVLSGMGALPLAGGTLLAANLAGLRSQRDGTAELYDSLPRPERTRTAAQLLAVGWAVAVTAVLTAATYAALGGGSLVVNAQGLRHVPAVAELAHGPLAVAACGAAGVLLARRLRSAIVAPVLVVALLAAEVPLAVWGSQLFVRWALPFVNDARIVPDSWVPCSPAAVTAHCSLVLGYDVAGLTAHAAYLIVVTAVAAWLAVGRVRRDVARDAREARA